MKHQRDQIQYDVFGIWKLYEVLPGFLKKEGRTDNIAVVKQCFRVTPEVKRNV
jgi:hypothetical protein